ncbi:MAG: DedA family protein [Deltaproteobacteria bacterium]|nr:DedA family protein [Deltaproteobacteria bacterium]
MSCTERFLSFLDSLPELPTYFFLGLSAYVENIFPPIPGDTITAFGAFMVGMGKLGFFGVYISTTLGSLLGFLSLFWLGGIFGRRFFMERDYRFFRAGDILKAEQWFGRYGYLLIAMNRFLPGVRSAVSLAGGLSRLRPAWVALLAFLSCAVWNLIWITMGYLLGSNWQTIDARMSALLMKYNLAVFALFVLIVLFVLVMRLVVRHRSGKR